MNEKVYWGNSNPPEELTKEQKRAFSWLIKIFKKKPEELTDHEKQAQEIYRNVLIFSKDK